MLVSTDVLLSRPILQPRKERGNDCFLATTEGAVEALPKRNSGKASPRPNCGEWSGGVGAAAAVKSSCKEGAGAAARLREHGGEGGGAGATAIVKSGGGTRRGVGDSEVC